MKTITFLTMGILLFSSQFALSQVKLDSNNTQPQAASVNNLDEMRYFYYPNLETYFDTQKGLYLSYEAGSWVTSESLNLSGHGYSLKNGHYKKLKCYTGDEPYTMLVEHKLQYPADYSSRPTKKLIAAVD